MWFFFFTSDVLTNCLNHWFPIWSDTVTCRDGYNSDLSNVVEFLYCNVIHTGYLHKGMIHYLVCKSFPIHFYPRLKPIKSLVRVSLYFLETKKLPQSNCSFGRSRCLLTMYHMYKASQTPKHCCQSYRAYNLYTSTQSIDFPHLYSLFSAFISSSFF